MRWARGYAGLLLVLLALAAFAWPERSRPLRFPDSAYFSSWQAFEAPAEIGDAGRKPPAYPLFLRVVGRGARLVHAQTWISLACWCFLGWTLARTTGALIAGLLALSPLIRPWNLALLSESLSLSLLALLLALSLARRRSRPTRLAAAAWWATLVAFATVRDVHLLVLPVAALVLLPRRSPAATGEWRRFADGTFVLALLLAVGLYSVERHRRTVMPAYTALVMYVFPDPVASAALREAGMPDTNYPLSEALETWIVEGGRSTYAAWVLAQPGAYLQAGRSIAPPTASARLQQRYFARRSETEPGWIDRAGGLVARVGDPPAWLWLLALLSPLVEWMRFRRVTSASVAPAVLATTTYGLAFAAYWGAGSETLRHGLVAAVLYRLTFVVGLAAWVDVIRRPGPTP